VEHRVEHDHVAARIGQIVEVVGIADLEREIGPRLGERQADAQRQRIDADHATLRPHQVGDVLGEQAGAATDIEHALARPDCEIGNQALAGLELPRRADAVVVAGQFGIVERQGRLIDDAGMQS
jgi:hypothetical protein